MKYQIKAIAVGYFVAVTVFCLKIIPVGQYKSES
jgi:hypothetical protein